jgi:predicted RNA-binding Zn-ribbon protein involved in translation (DUF1610 family)
MNKSNWNEIELKNYVKNSFTYIDVLRKIKISSSCGNYRTLKNYIKKYSIDISHFKRPYHKSSHAKALSLLLTENSPVSSYRLKNRLLKENFLKNQCCLCNQKSLWNGKNLNMVLDHINGVYDDSRIENLRMVCPNCNSQLDTNCGKNVSDKNNYKCIKCGVGLSRKTLSGLCKKCYFIQINENPSKGNKDHSKNKICISCGSKIRNNKSGKCFKCVDRNIIKNKPTKDILEELIKNTPMTKIGEKYQVSSNSVKKWCKKYGIILESRLGYWTKIKYRSIPGESPKI